MANRKLIIFIYIKKKDLKVYTICFNLVPKCNAAVLFPIVFVQLCCLPML